MGSLSTTEMPRLDKVIHPSGEIINSKSHGYGHRKHMKKSIQCDGSGWRGMRGRRGFVFTLFYFNHRIPLYVLPPRWETVVVSIINNLFFSHFGPT